MTELLTDLIASLPAWGGILASLAGFLAVGAITSSNVQQGTDFFACDLSASTADTTGSIAHGLGAIASNAALGAGLGPLDVKVQARTAAGNLSAWRVVSVDTTNVNLAKNTTSLSGGNAQAQLIVNRPHSIGR